MIFWIGNYNDIMSAEALASEVVTAKPEFKNHVQLAKNEWITSRWAVPQETTTANVWAIPAYAGIETPQGCVVVNEVEFLEIED